MSDLISRQALINALKEYFSDEFTAETEYGAYWHHQHVIDAIERMPSAQPERKVGRWINYKDEHCCSVCDWVIIEDCWDEENRYDYCPYCGARMGGEEDE